MAVSFRCIGDLYSGFKIADEELSGNLTLPENIADFGGVKISYRAYHEWHRMRHEGLMPTEAQNRLFWIAYGQLWCDKERYKTLKLGLSDSHSPGPFRVNGVVSQNRHFADMFRCKAGAPMNPTFKCIMWGDAEQGGKRLQQAGRGGGGGSSSEALASLPRKEGGGGGAEEAGAAYMMEGLGGRAPAMGDGMRI